MAEELESETAEALVQIEINLAEALNSFDTCDACSIYVQAHAVVILPSENILTLCAHHVHQHHDSLVDQGAVIHARAVPA